MRHYKSPGCTYCFGGVWRFSANLASFELSLNRNKIHWAEMTSALKFAPIKNVITMVAFCHFASFISFVLFVYSIVLRVHSNANIHDEIMQAASNMLQGRQQHQQQNEPVISLSLSLRTQEPNKYPLIRV